MNCNKKMWIKRILVIGAMLIFSMPVYAQTNKDSLETNAREITVTDRYIGKNVSRITGVTRGKLISSVGIELEDQGFGVAHIDADIMCHEAMSSIRMVLTLQKWNEENQSWDAVNRQEFSWDAKDLPEGEDLNMALVSYNVAGLSGVYRVRGLFGVYDINGSYNETWNAYTDGVTF